MWISTMACGSISRHFNFQVCLPAMCSKPADAKKALADRARWRADERRWVRDGKLPRCGWMDERVPESPRWTEREPERVAEQIKLEQKRQALQSRRAEEVEI